MTAIEETILVFVIVFFGGLAIVTMYVLNGIHKTAKEMKDDVKRYEEKYGKIHDNEQAKRDKLVDRAYETALKLCVNETISWFYEQLNAHNMDVYNISKFIEDYKRRMRL